MISSGHTSAEISYFLHKWSLNAKKILGDLNISQIEIDFSWVLIHSSCSIFLKCDIESYLNKCWNMVDVNSDVNERDFKVILHLCSAHLMHSIGFHINKKFKLNKDVRKQFLHCIGFIVRAVEITSINKLFQSLCYVFMSHSLSAEAKTHIHLLETYISNENVDFLETSEYLEEEYMDDNNHIENKDSKTFREKSPFGKHFVNIARFCKTWIDNNHGKKEDSNPCNIPELIEYLLTYYSPILPLWSGIVIGPTSVSDKNKNNIIYSNAIVENWMRIVKLNILESKTNLRPGDLIKLLYPSILSRLSAFQFAFHPRAKKIFKGHKRVRDNLEEQCVEEWSRKKETVLWVFTTQII